MVQWSGQEGAREKGVYIMIMDLLGPSLEDLFKFCGGRFSLKTALMVGHQMVKFISSYLEARYHCKTSCQELCTQRHQA